MLKHAIFKRKLAFSNLIRKSKCSTIIFCDISSGTEYIRPNDAWQFWNFVSKSAFYCKNSGYQNLSICVEVAYIIWKNASITILLQANDCMSKSHFEERWLVKIESLVTKLSLEASIVRCCKTLPKSSRVTLGVLLMVLIFSKTSFTASQLSSSF